MGNENMDFINEVINSIAKLTERVEVLEKEIAHLKGIDTVSFSEPSDIETFVMPEVPEIEIEVTAEATLEEAQEAIVPEEEVTEATPEEASEEADMPKSLFGGESETKLVEAKHHILNINEVRKPEKAFMDTMTDKFAWKHDMPGPEVKDIRSAIALNDRVLFIGTLFRGDSMLYQDTILKLNEMKSIDSVVKYITETFPEWKMDSDNVYRFMMAVRRKIR